jgi:hypothetical protein
MRCATRSLSSRRSVRPHSARPYPAVTSGFRLIASVHCGGREQIRPSAKRSSHRFPDRLPRFAMHTPTCPERGWKGWVTVTRCGEAGDTPAFPTESQAASTKLVPLAADHERGNEALSGGICSSLRRPRLDACSDSKGDSQTNCCRIRFAS